MALLSSDSSPRRWIWPPVRSLAPPSRLPVISPPTLPIGHPLPPSYPSLTPGCPQVTQLNGQAAGRHVVHVGELVDQLSKPAVLHVGEQGQLLQHVRTQTAHLAASFL